MMHTKINQQFTQVEATNIQLPNPHLVLPEPLYETVPNLFFSWVERTPTQIAISQGILSYTYQELANSAYGIAQVLLNQGIEPQQVVAVFGPRSFGLIASLIGVWLSGGVFLTLDEKLPIQRRKLMLKEAQAKYFLQVGEQLPEEEVRQTTTLIQINQNTGQPLELALNNNLSLPTVNPNDAAYIFFTSGTTGIPKGVLGQHKGLSHFLTWQRQTFAIGSQDRCSQLTGLSFDVLLRDIFLPLTSGATLCLLKKDSELGHDKILPWLVQEQISVLSTVPTLAQSWLVNITPKVSLPSLRWLFFGGEPLTDKLVLQWRKIFPTAGEIVNFYGPTEMMLAKCYYCIPAEILHGIQPLGYSIPNSQALVLKENFQLCGINEPGEIVLRSPFRSLGYINAPEEEQKHFVKNPFRNDKEDLLYYTGDRGRYRIDGSLEFLGRLDNQVKIRGIRIELGEIEVLLNQHPRIQQVAIIVSEKQFDDRHLIAYVVPKTKDKLTFKALRHFLQKQLPEYMIPSTFVQIETMPLTPNGKIDRNALSKLDVEISTSTQHPATPTEYLLAGLWASVLKRSAISRDDNFLELGGHSLLATQLIARIRDAFQVELPVRAVFEHSVLCELAEQITQSQMSKNVPQSVFIKATKLDTPYNTALPISLTELELWFMEKLYPHAADMYYLPLTCRLTGKLNIARLAQSVKYMAQCHTVLRSGFMREGDKVVRVVQDNFSIPFEIIDLRALPTEKRETIAQQQLTSGMIESLPFPQGPLWRCVLWQMSEDEHWFLFVIHHIISDGWSLSVIAQEIAQHYRTFEQGLPLASDERDFGYPHFAAWQWQYFNSEQAQPQCEYWCRVLRELPPPLRFPDSPCPTERKFDGDAHFIQIAPTLLVELQQLSRQNESTLFVTLLTAFKLLLYAYTRRDDLVVGTPLANRTQGEFENEIGFFVNTLPIRTNLSGNPSGRELLARVKESSMGVIAHQQTPFIKVLEWTQPPIAIGQAQLHQVLFALQNTPEIKLEFGDQINVEMLPLSETEHAVEFDLFMSLQENENGIMGALLYRQDMFSSTWIAQFCEDYQLVLQRLVKTPDAPMAALLKGFEISVETYQTNPAIKTAVTNGNQPPVTEIEQLLLTLWQTVLGAGVSSIHDDFLALGGSSLQLLKLLQQIEATFACQISVRALFEHTTIHQQGLLIAEHTTG